MSSTNSSNNVLSEKDANVEMTGTAEVGIKGQMDTNSMEYHRQVLANKMAQETGDGANDYVSPSDGIQSPCSAKLTAYKNKQFGKAKPQSLFARTSSKNIAAQGGLFGNKASTTPGGAMFGDKPADSESK